MSHNKALPDYVREELERRGIAILNVGVNGSGHDCVEFVGPNGVGVFKWSWPRGNGHSDPRAFRNNRSQLRRHLRRIYGEERSDRGRHQVGARQ